MTPSAPLCYLCDAQSRNSASPWKGPRTTGVIWWEALSPDPPSTAETCKRLIPRSDHIPPAPRVPGTGERVGTAGPCPALRTCSRLSPSSPRVQVPGHQQGTSSRRHWPQHFPPNLSSILRAPLRRTAHHAQPRSALGSDLRPCPSSSLLYSGQHPFQVDITICILEAMTCRWERSHWPQFLSY